MDEDKGRLEICSFQLLRLLALCFAAGFIAEALTKHRSEVRKTNCICTKPLIIITQIIQYKSCMISTLH